MLKPHFLPVLCLAAATLAADDNPDTAVNQTPIAMSPVVVTTDLDKAREDIVPSLGAASYHLDKLQIEAVPFGADAAFNQVLLRTPGVAQDSFGQVHLRGEHADLQYRINDVLLPEGLSGFGQELDTRFVETVNVLTGSLPAQFGFRTAGVVDIHTQTGAPRSAGNLGVYGGSFDTLRGSVEDSGTAGRLGIYGTASAETNALGIENPTDRRAALHDRTRQFKTFSYLSWLIDPTSRLNVMLSGSFARFQIPNRPGQMPAFQLDGVSTFNSASLDENQREDNGYAIVAYQKAAGDLSAQVSAFVRYSLVHYTPDPIGDLMFNGVASDVRRDLSGSGLEADLRWSVAPAHTIRSGLLFSGTNAGTRTTTTVFPVDANGNQASATPVAITDSQRRLGLLCGAYLQDEWKPLTRLTLNLGVRADAARGYVSEGQISPRVNLVYQMTEATNWHAGYARYFTPPPLELVSGESVGKFAGTTNASAVAASSPVRSERAHYFDAGVSQQLSPAVTMTLDGYYKRATNSLDEGQFGQALIFSPFNYARGVTYGAELGANYSRQGISVYGNLAIGRATGREIVSGEFQFSPDELAYIASHDVHLDHDQLLTASAGVSYRIAAVLVSADLLYGSGLRRGFANSDHLAEYHPLNVGLAYTLTRSGRRELVARVDVVNLLDEVYQLRDGSGIGVGAPQFGHRRGATAGLTLAF